MAPPKRKGGRTLPATPSSPTTAKRVTKKIDGHADEPVHSSVSSTRYTPPIPKQMKVSPPWVPALMGVFLVVGTMVIVLNYLGVLPGDTSNTYLLVGLGMILAGIVTATQWR